MTMVPYVIGQWVRGERFYGRTRLIQEILEGPRDSIWLLGTRRIGKTSLLREVELRCNRDPESPFLALFWDMQGSQDLDGLRESLLESIEDAEERFEKIDIQIDDLESRDLFETLRQLRRRPWPARTGSRRWPR